MRTDSPPAALLKLVETFGEAPGAYAMVPIGLDQGWIDYCAIVDTGN